MSGVPGVFSSSEFDLLRRRRILLTKQICYCLSLPWALWKGSNSKVLNLYEINTFIESPGAGSFYIVKFGNVQYTNTHLQEHTHTLYWWPNCTCADNSTVPQSSPHLSKHTHTETPAKTHTHQCFTTEISRVICHCKHVHTDSTLPGR